MQRTFNPITETLITLGLVVTPLHGSGFLVQLVGIVASTVHGVGCETINEFFPFSAYIMSSGTMDADQQGDIFQFASL